MLSEDYGWLLRIRFRLHPLFWLMILGSLLTERFLEVATLFALVLSHELGHVCMARERGWRIQEIELLPFGGVAKVVAPWHATSREEMEVAIAGPLVNAVMIPVALFCCHIGLWQADWTLYYVQCNLLLALFNLLPIAPLDGGKLLLAFLSRRMPYRRALEWVNRTSFFGAALMLAVGLLWYAWDGHIYLNLALLAIFLGLYNHAQIRQIPYHFLQFLLARRERQNAQRFPSRHLRLPEGTLVREAVAQLWREAHNLYEVRCANGQTEWITEERLLTLYFDQKMPHAEIGRLIC